MLKNSHKKILSILMILVMILSLSACSGDRIDGTYISNDAAKQKFTFKDNTVTMSAFGLNVDGTFELNDTQIVITYTIPILGDQVWRASFSKNGKNLIISGTEFIKQ
ncbi:MAG: hypothetical protein IKP88_17110 [Lachnospiraceae bacterium]|nr:hypothetical protein [Lachnospiraceae bacterium]